jgi:N-acetylneuraminic acid mutarotase
MLQGLGGHSVAAVGGDLLVFGGTNWENGALVYRDDIARFNPGEGWTTHAPPLPSPTAYSAVFTSNGSVFLIGGASHEALEQAAYCLPPDSGNWLPISALPQPVRLAASCCTGPRGWLIGGATTAGDFRICTSAMWSIDPDAIDSAWTAEPDFPGSPRAIQTAVAVGSKIFVFGGATMNSTGDVQNHDDAWCFDTARSLWSRIRDMPLSLRGMSGLSLNDRYVLLMGGAEQRNGTFVMSAETFIYDTFEDHYITGPRLPVAAALMCSAVMGGRVYLLGGEDKFKSRNARMFSASVQSLINYAGRSNLLATHSDLVEAFK